MIKRIFASLTFLLVGFLAVSNVFAEEITISNNGAGSNNNVAISNSSSSTVEQTNNADIQNNVETNANTGDNSASSNNADANITSGNIENSSTVSNENINTNFAEGDMGCSGCSSDVTINIENNGSDSINGVNLGISNTTDITQTNSAQITNNSQTHANTGNNQANNNNGDVTIKTGNITSLASILNKNINLNSDPQGDNNSSISVSINNNGSGSINSIVLFFGNSLNYLSNNFADIKNNVTQNLNTGNNIANNNNGAVLIATGDIISVITIGNENINGSFFNPPPTQIIPPPGGGGVNPPGEIPPGAQPPASGTNPSGGNGSSVGGPGQVLGAAIGNILPATGAYWILLMTILAITMFLWGGFLRFGSDPSPPLAYAV